MSASRAAGLVLALSLSLIPTSVHSQTGVQLTLFAQGLASPVDIEPVGDGRLFVVERGGRIKIVESSGTVSGTFLDLSTGVRSDGGEEGLLGLALAPDYSTTGRFFVYYTRPDGNNQLSRFTRVSSTQADPNSETPVLTIPHPTNSNHNGGDLAFRDGLLYASIGDGGSGNDPPTFLLGTFGDVLASSFGQGHDRELPKGERMFLDSPCRSCGPVRLPRATDAGP